MTLNFHLRSYFYFILILGDLQISTHHRIEFGMLIQTFQDTEKILYLSVDTDIP